MRLRFAFRWLLLSILFLLAAPVLPQSEKAADPAQDKLRAQVDAVFAVYDKPDSPGCALGVIKNGRLIYARGYGMANLEHKIPLSAKTVFDIGSTSKQFTAASILLLAQQGKLALDDDIRKFVPEIPIYQRPATIRHLLHHTSGIRDYLGLMSLAGTNFDDVTTEDDALQLIARQKAPNFTPGDEHLYSNSGYFLLSVIVKRASGKLLRQFAEENIFGPLGMKNTHFHDDHTMIVPGRATGYAPRPGGGFRIEMSNFEQTGDGAVMTTLEDLLLWDQNFYQPKVGGKELINQLLVPGTLSSGEKLIYAAGLVVEPYKGLKLISHGGAWAGYRAELIRFPEQQFSIACLCNLATTNPSNLARRVADIYLADQLVTEAGKQPGEANTSPAFTTLAKEELEKKVGLYRNYETGAVRRISLRDGKLRIDQFGAGFELAPLSPNQFRVVGPAVITDVTFESPNAQAPLRLRLARAGSRPEIFEAVKQATPTATELAEYQGTFFSEELSVAYEVKLDQGKLALRGRNAPRAAFQPTFKDAFIIPGMQFEFTRDAQSRITGFAVHAGRIRNVRFAKQR